MDVKSKVEARTTLGIVVDVGQEGRYRPVSMEVAGVDVLRSDEQAIELHIEVVCVNLHQSFAKGSV